LLGRRKYIFGRKLQAGKARILARTNFIIARALIKGNDIKPDRAILIDV
jgi:hypothetical protein